MGLMHSIWTFVMEGFGYNRRIDSPVDDQAEREAAIARVDQLERAIEMVYREQAQLFHERAEHKRTHQ